MFQGFCSGHAVALFVIFEASVGGCALPARRAPEADVVPCPLNARANLVLRNLVERCALPGGGWDRDMGPGCPRIWAPQFGLMAGTRRQREDLIALGERTIARESADVDALILHALFGEIEAEGPAAFGLPALLVSGVRNGNDAHFHKFRLVFHRALEHLDTSSLRENQRAGLAALLAGLASALPSEVAIHLRRARELADTVTEAELRAFALAAIARASRSEEDIARARDAVEAAVPPMRLEEGRLAVEVPETYVLSTVLSLSGALADMAQLTGEPRDRTRAEALLNFAFSEHLFDGRFLMHDGRRDGRRTREFCSGCNLNALYLVDRLYGDTFKIDPLPEIPARPAQTSAQRTTTHDLFPLSPGQPGTYGALDFGVTVAYTELPGSEQHPRGALRLRITLNDGVQRCRFELLGDGEVLVPLDDHDRVIYKLGGDAVVSGEYDPEISGYTIEVGPEHKGFRDIRIHAMRHTGG